MGGFFGTPGGNRTHNGPLGVGCYIHLTTGAYSLLCFFDPRRREYSLRSWRSVASLPRLSAPQRPLRRGLLYPFNYGSLFFYYVLFDPRRREYSLRSWRSDASRPRLATPTAPLGWGRYIRSTTGAWPYLSIVVVRAWIETL